MIAPSGETTYAPAQSLRTRILLVLAASILLMIAATVGFVSTRIDHMSRLQIEHEGMVLANSLEAALEHPLGPEQVARFQAYIDELVAIRPQNDIEINLMMFRGDASHIVASNAPTNIEPSDDEEHLEFLEVLASNEPSLYIETVEPWEDEEDRISHTDPNHPDFHFPVGSRLLSITTPVKHAGADVGCINLVMSLRFLDEERADLATWSILALSLGVLALAGGLLPFLTRKLFRPLNRLAEQMYHFGVGGNVGELAPTTRHDEIGVLQNEFFGMVARIKSAEAMREELARARAEKKERELEARLQQAQKMEALGTLAGGIAHDFNNILTPIMGYTDLLAMKLAEDSDLQKDLGEVARATGRAKDMVRQILTFSRQSEEERSPLQVGSIVKEAMKLLRASIPANVEVRQDIRDRDAQVLGCPTHIHQVVVNLATNACQAMVEEGGRLDVILEEKTLDAPAEQGGITLAPGPYLRLMVADTGPGIKPQVMERIFEPYFTTKEEGKGTGLGLAMVHGIVQDMGGAIGAGTELGKGTTFEAWFPVCDVEAARADAAAEFIPGGNERVLIVDDEGSIAEMIGEMLNTLGYETDTFNDPAEALDRVTGPEHYDLVISDVAMPGMTGVELVRRMNGNGVTRPVLLCSAYTGGINWQGAESLGIKALLMKPIKRAELGRAVREALDE